MSHLLDPGFALTLRPMRYPAFYEMYRDAVRNTWTVEEVDLTQDLTDWEKLTADEKHLTFAYTLSPAAADTWQTFDAPTADIIPVTVQAAGGGQRHPPLALPTPGTRCQLGRAHAGGGGALAAV